MHAEYSRFSPLPGERKRGRVFSVTGVLATIAFLLLLQTSIRRYPASTRRLSSPASSLSTAAAELTTMGPLQKLKACAGFLSPKPLAGSQWEMGRLRGGEGEAEDVEMTEASHCRKGMVALLKEKPCKITDNAVSKVGKHGAAKCHLIGIDIFTGKRVEEICPGHTMLKVPSVKKTELQVIDVTPEGELSLMNEDNTIRDDLEMPENQELAREIQKMFDEGKDVVVQVTKCVGKEEITGAKLSKD